MKRQALLGCHVLSTYVDVQWDGRHIAQSSWRSFWHYPDLYTHLILFIELNVWIMVYSETLYTLNRVELH